MPVLAPTEYELLEDGVYEAKLKSVEAYVTQEQKHRLRWRFDAKTEEGVSEVSDTTSLAFSSRSKARPWVEGLIGRTLAADERIDTDDLIGRRCRLVLSIRKTDVGDFQNIDKILPAKVAGQESAPAPIPRDDLPF